MIAILALFIRSGSAQEKTILGFDLPPDALPYDQQVYRIPCNNTANSITFDFSVSVYQPYCGADLFNDPLITFDKAQNPQPGAAESWSVAADGVTWSFVLREGLMWSDGTPVTAHDYVGHLPLQRQPRSRLGFRLVLHLRRQGWDQELGRGHCREATCRSIGGPRSGRPHPRNCDQGRVSAAAQDHEIRLHATEEGLGDARPLLQQRPGHLCLVRSLYAGMLESFDHGFKVVFKANPYYTGYRPPRLARIEGIYLSPATYFIAYLNNEIDTLNFNDLSPADFATIQRDPELQANYLRPGLIGTDYVFFDAHSPPFDDVNVRKAFAHAIDREAIVKGVYGEIKATPAHSMLMPGFPAADVEGELAHYQRFDCGLAKEHLAQAGFPNGAGFPPQVMWLRNENPGIASVYQAAAASISQCLGVSIQVSNKDNKVFMDALHERPTGIALGAVAYSIDFADPINLLGIWVSSGRHSWRNQRFDAILDETSNLMGDPQRRDQLFRDAERILVDDVGGAFIAHRWAGDLFRPTVRGASIREPGPEGTYGKHSGNDWLWGDLYIGAAQ